MTKTTCYNKVQRLLLHPPTYVTYKDKRFLIIDTPSISNISRYIKVKPQNGFTLFSLSPFGFSLWLTHKTLRSLNAGMLQTSFVVVKQLILKAYWQKKEYKFMTGFSRMVNSLQRSSLMNGLNWLTWGSMMII